ncbi:MAG: hypothetical protein PHC80_06240 [Eubacteriales bacterium]|nr:hypothetical protein [Eubacteriales bacterium]
MKKFVFTNESLLHIKNDEHERLKRELENVDKRIRQIDEEILSIDSRVFTEQQKQETDCEAGTDAQKLMQYEDFFRYMRERREDAVKKRAELEKERAIIQKDLFAVHNQIKVLEEMRDAQYQEYLKEVALDESKELETMMSFNLYEGAS